MWRRTGPPAGANVADSRRQFLSWLIGIALVALAVAAGGTLLPLPLARYVVPAGMAIVIAVGFFVRPTPAILALALLVLFADTLKIYLGEPVKQLDEAALVVVTPLALWVGRDRLRARTWVLREAAIVGAVLAGLVSAWTHGVPVTVWIPATLLFGKAAAVFYVVLSMEFRIADIRRVGEVVAGLGAVLVALGFVELWNPPAFQGALGLPRYDRVRGGLPSVKALFFHPVLFGWFTVFVAIYASSFYAQFRRRRLLLLALFMSGGTLLSGRRKALIGLAAAVLAGVASARLGQLRGTLRPWLQVAGGILVVAIVFTPFLASLYGATVARYVTAEPALGGSPAPGTSAGASEGQVFSQARTALYVTSMRIAVDEFPLGEGFGRFGSWISRTDYSPVYRVYGIDNVYGLRPQNPVYATDTFWPMVVGEAGVLGLAAYMVFIATVLASVWRAMRSTSAPIILAFCTGTLLVLIEALLESLAAPNLIAPPIAYFTFGAAAMAISVAADHPGRPRPATVRAAPPDPRPPEPSGAKAGQDASAEGWDRP